MKSEIKYVSITYFPQTHEIRYRVEKTRASETSLTGTEPYRIRYTERTIPRTIIDYISNSKYSLTWDSETEHKECIVSNSKSNIEYAKDIYSVITYFSNYKIEER